MTITRMLAAAFIAAGAATALAAPALADESLQDQQFIAGLDQLGISVGTDARAIGLAHSTCEVLFRGKPVSYALYHLKNATDLSDDDITKFGGAALRVYCPKYLP